MQTYTIESTYTAQQRSAPDRVLTHHDRFTVRALSAAHARMKARALATRRSIAALGLPHGWLPRETAYSTSLDITVIDHGETAHITVVPHDSTNSEHNEDDRI